MKKTNYFFRSLLLLAVTAIMGVSNLQAQTDFKAWEFKTGHSGIAGGNLTFTGHSITIEFWMNMTQATATTASSNVFESFLDPNGINICVRANSANSNALELRFFVKDTQATPQAVFFYVPSATYTDKWAHFAFVVSETDGKAYLYVNGELLGQAAAVGGYFGNYKADGTTTRAFNVGGAFWTSPKFYGKMADIRVWSVARTAQEIKANYNKNLVGTNADNPGLYLNYRFYTYERGVLNDANPDVTTNKGWCNPSTAWDTYYATETLSSYPRNLAIADGTLSWDTSAGTWEVTIFKTDDNTSVYTGTVATNSVSLSNIT
ncbi:MAG: LamG domain-containing protein [Paludibacter sp.]